MDFFNSCIELVQIFSTKNSISFEILEKCIEDSFLINGVDQEVCFINQKFPHYNKEIISRDLVEIENGKRIDLKIKSINLPISCGENRGIIVFDNISIQWDVRKKTTYSIELKRASICINNATIKMFDLESGELFISSQDISIKGCIKFQF
jgi:hypothetical protein